MKTKHNLVKLETIKENPFKAIGKEWMLVVTGTKERHNMMTASWGGWGVLWHKNVCFCFIRPHRYTYELMEKNSYYTLCFFDKRYKKALDLCGSMSGRDLNKTEATGLTPLATKEGAVYFKEARLVFVCRKIYFQQITPAHFLDPAIEENYPKKDYHQMYVGEVVRCLRRA